MAQVVSLAAGAQVSCARYVDWLQVQGFLDMAESALRAKNAANDRLVREKSSVAKDLSQQTEQVHQVLTQGQAEDTAFLRQQLEALLQERAAAKERIAGLERENKFLLYEREILVRQLELEAGNVESDRSLQSLLSARRLDDDLAVRRFELSNSRPTQHEASEPTTPQDPTEAMRPSTGQGSQYHCAQALISAFMQGCSALQTAEVKDGDSSDRHAVNPMLETSCFSTGYTSGQENAHEQSASRGSAGDSPVHWPGSPWQSLQIHSDHNNAAYLLPESSLRQQGSGEMQRQQRMAN